ncbi:MAG TPA: hypothetical protein VES67_26005 [Vicinamibacterales bacterium]|nr:hypothetical protein [Vicinamibacterales bacterium]
MKRQTPRAWAVRTGVLSLIAIVVAHLALTDIAHGEADLTLEWNVLRASFVIIIAFHVLALRALVQTNGAPSPQDSRMTAGSSSQSSAGAS